MSTSIDTRSILSDKIGSNSLPALNILLSVSFKLAIWLRNRANFNSV